MEIKEVVDKAAEAITQMYGDSISQIILEEIQLSDDNTKWLVTLSFAREKLPSGSSTGITLTYAYPQGYERIYKKIELGAKDGKFIGMTIRKT